MHPFHRCKKSGEADDLHIIDFARCIFCMTFSER
jgi:hypothetical protein